MGSQGTGLSVILCLVLVFVRVKVNAEVRNQVRYNLTEEEPSSTVVGNVGADSGLQQQFSDVFSQLRFSIMSQSSSYTSLFSIAPQGGVLSTASQIDRESYCAGAATCSMDINIQVMPLEYFHIIKVTIEVMDINDNIPTFPYSQVIRTISEASVPGAKIRLDPAVDPDSPRNSIQRYSLFDSTNSFDLQTPNSGIRELNLILQKSLDREVKDSYTMTLVAYDGFGPSANSGTTLIEVTVQDLNDNAPEFLDLESFSYVYLNESAPPNTFVTKVKARDPDSGDNGQIVFNLQDTTAPFRINATTGDIFTTSTIDREIQERYELTIEASDRGENSLQVSTIITIHILDLNDNAPQITIQGVGEDSEGNRIKVSEGVATGTFLAHVTVRDLDLGFNANFNCSLNNRDFLMEKIFESEFKIATARPLDREERSIYSLRLFCKDYGTPAMTSQAFITIQVLDVNDNAPVFKKSVYNFTVIENSQTAVPLFQVSATDLDIGLNGEVRYNLAPEARDNFTVNVISGDITPRISFDHEKASQYTFDVLAVDRGLSAQLTSSAQVIINVIDIDDEDPTFLMDEYKFWVPEDTAPNTSIGQVLAVDKDSPPYNSFQYSLINNELNSDPTFVINSATGHLISLTHLDREKRDEYHMVAMVTSTGLRSVSSSVPVIIYVTDVNDHAPVITYPTSTNNTIYVSNMTPKQTYICTATAFDLDFAGLTFHLIGESSGNEYFTINQTTGDIKTIQDLEHASSQAIQLNILVQDGGSPPRSAQSTLIIQVNSSIPYQDKVTSSMSNHIIVIAIACTSGIIMVILLIAIAAILLQQRRRADKNRDTGLAALAAQKHAEAKANAYPDKKHHLYNGQCPRDVVGQGHMTGSGLNNGGYEGSKEDTREDPSWNLYTQPNKLKKVRRDPPSVPAGSPCPSPPPPPKPPRSYEWNSPSSSPIKGKVLPPLPLSPSLGSPDCYTSVTSGHSEGSDVTDSGRGSSDEVTIKRWPGRRSASVRDTRSSMEDVKSSLPSYGSQRSSSSRVRPVSHDDAALSWKPPKADDLNVFDNIYPRNGSRGNRSRQNSYNDRVVLDTEDKITIHASYV